jgi:uncharacterized protein YbbK (DUF523 family)
MKQKAMISKCMLGVACRYDGQSKSLEDEKLKLLKDKYDLIPFCPEEVALPTPRPAVRFVGEKLISVENIDRTKEFEIGANKALEICQKENIEIFIGKEKSPSCGIYKTSASVNGEEIKIDKKGLTSEVLSKNGIKLISEFEL